MKICFQKLVTVIPIGKAKVLLEGSDVTLVSYGIGINIPRS